MRRTRGLNNRNFIGRTTSFYLRAVAIEKLHMIDGTTRGGRERRRTVLSGECLRRGLLRQFNHPPLRLVRKIGELLRELVTPRQHQPAPFHFPNWHLSILDQFERELAAHNAPRACGTLGFAHSNCSAYLRSLALQAGAQLVSQAPTLRAELLSMMMEYIRHIGGIGINPD
jgi:hypothetical protein